jgi:hypothetical protein
MADNELLAKAEAIQNQKLLEQAQEIQSSKLNPPDQRGIVQKASDYITKTPTLEGIGKSTLESLPSAGAAVGQAVGSIPGAGVGSVAGYVGKNAIEQLREKGIGALLQPPTMAGTVQAAKDEGRAFISGTEQAMMGSVIGKGLSKLGEAFHSAKKSTADAVTEAAQRLGFDSTPGMTLDSPTVQGMESSLSQSPSLAGNAVRKDTEPVFKGLQNASKQVLSEAGSESEYQTGVNISRGFVGNMGEKYSNVQMGYEPFNEELPKMVPQLDDKWKLADQIAKSSNGHLSLDTDMDKYANSVANKIMDSNSLEDLENVRKQVGRSLETAYAKRDFNAVDSLSKIQDHLGDFRDDQFVKLSQSAAPGPHGENMGQEMVNQYQQTRQAYAQMMSDMKDAGRLLGVKTKDPKSFIEAIQNISPEKLDNKLFGSDQFKAVQATQKFQQYFPEQFEQMKALKLKEIAEKSLNSHGEIDPGKMIKQVDKFGPEMKDILFGDKISTINDIKTVLQSIPDKMGPSGTPQGNLFNAMAHPFMQAGEGLRYGQYRALSSPMLNSAAESMGQFGNSPAGQAAAGMGPGNLINSGIKATITNIIRPTSKLRR